jgi:hypothetical protein
MGLSQFGTEQEARRSEQLELTFPDRTYTEEPVYVVHSEREHLLLTLLLFTHLNTTVTLVLDHNGDIIQDHKIATLAEHKSDFVS